MSTQSQKNAMYTIATKVAGYWTIMLESNSVVQFRSLSRKLADEWRDANEPVPAQAVLNATAGKAVWRAR